jgi:YVTN family beta-propeller protein
MKSLRLFIFSLLFATTLAFTQANPHIYILSEGGFSAGTSRLDRYETSSQTYHSNVFQNGSLGLYPDGLLVHGETLYITEQGGFGGTGTIYLADTLGVVQAAADAGINPYMLALHSDKLYITNGPAGLVTVLNAADLSPVTGIGVGVFPQEIVAHGDYVYVANNSLWGGDNDYTVSVIDPATDQVINSVYVGLNPSAIAPLPDGSVLVGVPWTDSGGKIYRIEPVLLPKQILLQQQMWVLTEIFLWIQTVIISISWTLKTALVFWIMPPEKSASIFNRRALFMLTGISTTPSQTGTILPMPKILPRQESGGYMMTLALFCFPTIPQLPRNAWPFTAAPSRPVSAITKHH